MIKIDLIDAYGIGDGCFKYKSYGQKYVDAIPSVGSSLAFSGKEYLVESVTIQAYDTNLNELTGRISAAVYVA